MKNFLPSSKQFSSLLSLSDFFQAEKEMMDTFDFLFESFKSPAINSFMGHYPKMNIKELSDSVIIEAAVPGLKKEEINISYKNGMLSIKAESNNENEGTSVKYICRELKKTSFVRTVSLNNNILDISKIESIYNNGILTITIPKKKEVVEQDKTIKIEIK